MKIKLHHLVWQDNCYHFRYVVPSDIREYVGQREFKRSLLTQVPLEAQAAARKLAGKVKQHLRIIRQKAEGSMDENKKREFIRRFVDTKLQADLHWDEDFRTHRDPVTPQHVEQELVQTEAWLEASKVQLAANDLSHLRSRVLDFARVYFPAEAEEFLADPAILQELTREVQKARIKMAAIEVERARGNHDSPYDTTQLPTPVAAEKVVTQVPHKHTHASSNFAEELQYENPKAPQEERAAYTRGNLQAMVKVLAEVPRQPNAWRFWSPLVALYTGMRQNEIGQLLVSDIVETDGVWCVDVNPKGEGKKVKTKASKRLIPIHSKLTELGFRDYVEKLRAQGKTRLWPDLVPSRDAHGQKISRWYAGWRKKWLTEQDLTERKDFHSLRHTFDNALKQAGLFDVRLPELMGHSVGKDQTFGRYGKRSNPRLLQEAIEKLDYGLDLSVLKGE